MVVCKFEFRAARVLIISIGKALDESCGGVGDPAVVPLGWRCLSANLTEGSETGAANYLAFQTLESHFDATSELPAEAPITSIRYCRHGECPAGFVACERALNHATGARQVFLCYSREREGVKALEGESFSPLVAVDIVTVRDAQRGPLHGVQEPNVPEQNEAGRQFRKGRAAIPEGYHGLMHNLRHDEEVDIHQALGDNNKEAWFRAIQAHLHEGDAAVFEKQPDSKQDCVHIIFKQAPWDAWDWVPPLPARVQAGNLSPSGADGERRQL